MDLCDNQWTSNRQYYEIFPVAGSVTNKVYLDTRRGTNKFEHAITSATATRELSMKIVEAIDFNYVPNAEDPPGGGGDD